MLKACLDYCCFSWLSKCALNVLWPLLVNLNENALNNAYIHDTKEYIDRQFWFKFLSVIKSILLHEVSKESFKFCIIDMIDRSISNRIYTLLHGKNKYWLYEKQTPFYTTINTILIIVAMSLSVVKSFLLHKLDISYGFQVDYIHEAYILQYLIYQTWFLKKEIREDEY